MAYTDDEIKSIFDSICKRIEDGEPLRRILKDDDMPSTSTFYIWIEEDPLKSKRYAYACENRADEIFEDILEIADGKDVKIIINEDGISEIDNTDVNRNKLQVDARKWVLAKMNPKKYGDASKIVHEGGENPIKLEVPTITINVIDGNQHNEEL